MQVLDSKALKDYNSPQSFAAVAAYRCDYRVTTDATNDTMTLVSVSAVYTLPVVTGGLGWPSISTLVLSPP